jgi:glycosyltransferase involved in cell wall biosynthesis
MTKQKAEINSGSRADDSGARLLIIISTLAIGGTERHVASVSSALRDRGWDVSIYSVGGEGPIAALLRSKGIRVILPPRGKGALARRIFRFPATMLHLLLLLSRERFAIVHCFLPEAYLVGAPIAWLTRIRLRIMSRRSLNRYQAKHPVAGFLERRLHSRMSAVIANSKNVMRELQTEGVAPERLGLIYNGLDSWEATPANRGRTREAMDVSEDTIVFVIVANLIPYKGHLDLVRAFGVAAPTMPANWRLWIVGRDDGLGPEIRTLAVSLGIDDKLVFLGPRDDVPDLLDASDVGLLSSHEEGFSNAILEGMRAGLPMIVTDVGGNAEAVIDGETGVVVPPRDPTAFAEAILRLAADRELRRILGERARRRVEEHFTLGSCVDAYEALYRGLRAGQLPGDISQIRYRP